MVPEYFSAHPQPLRSLSKFRLAVTAPRTTSTIQNVPVISPCALTLWFNRAAPRPER